MRRFCELHCTRHAGFYDGLLSALVFAYIASLGPAFVVMGMLLSNRLPEARLLCDWTNPLFYVGIVYFVVIPCWMVFVIIHSIWSMLFDFIRGCRDDCSAARRKRND